jgi:hypothetical protein
MDDRDSSPKPNEQTQERTIYCEQRRQLLDAFGEAVQDLVKLHEQQFLLVVEDDLNAHRFDLLIHDANEKKQNAKYAYLTHLEQHGCSSNE